MNQAVLQDMTLHAAVARAWQGADSNDEAANNLLAMMRRDPAIHALVMGQTEEEAARHAIGLYKRQQRTVIWTRPVAPDDRVVALTRTNALTLLDMRLPSGKRLADATHDEVIEAATVYKELSEQNAEKWRFLSAVAERVRGKKRVGDVLTAQQLEALRHG